MFKRILSGVVTTQLRRLANLRWTSRNQIRVLEGELNGRLVRLIMIWNPSLGYQLVKKVPRSDRLDHLAWQPHHGIKASSFHIFDGKLMALFSPHDNFLHAYERSLDGIVL